jgi:hypothetical protein
MFVILGFCAAWVAAALERPQLGLAMPLPVLALTAISQPAEGLFVAGLLGGVPLVAALAVLYGGDAAGASGLGRAFEVKRAVRGVAALAPVMALLVLVGNSSFLFPKPIYDPSQKPQKPRAVPLSAAQDRVLFEVDGPITGPWVIGALDVYDGRSWRLAPFDPRRLKPAPADGVVDPGRPAGVTVKFTTRDLGDTPNFPGVALVAKASFPGPAPLFDPRVGVFRVKTGRVPANLAYTMSLPAYPTAAQLQAAGPSVPPAMRELLQVPAPPPAVRQLLDQAPANPWLRLDFLRAKLNQVVVATGAGVPGDVPPSKVQDLLAGKHEGSPFEIVAAEALLARWAGVPSRIGFGFDGGQKENGATTIRPKNAAQFLQVWFKGFGWVPLVGAPPRAKTSLDTHQDQQFNPTIQPSDDVAVELYIPIRLDNLRQLYQRVRDVLLQVLPYAGAALAFYLGLPSLSKARRRAKRRRWAAREGADAQVAVEYAELRDQAADLGLGDPYDTPLEYLRRVVDDDEHGELAWLVTRVLYGDMARTVTAEDVVAAREMSESLRRRLFRAQPLQTRVLSVLSRASLHEPYTTEVPNVAPLGSRRARRALAQPRRRRRRAARRTVRRRRTRTGADRR